MPPIPTHASPAARRPFGTCSNGVSGMTNLYSNSALMAAGGKSTGTLDFYEVHYYTGNGANYSCFTHQPRTGGSTRMS